MAAAKKMLFVLDEDVRKEFEALIPSGQRSRVVNEALKKEVLFLKRKKAAEGLLRISLRTHSATAKEIAEELGKDRRRR